MFNNYFKIALRNLVRGKSFTVLNITGLSIGISVCIIILLFVQNELSYDRFNKEADRIYRVVFRASINGGKINESNVMPPLAKAMLNDYPEVAEATRLRQYGAPKITYKDKEFKNEEVAFVDANFFHLFTLPFKEGDPGSALSQPHSVVISRDVASKFFGAEDPLGKVLGFNNHTEYYKVTGVMENIPSEAHFHFGIFVSMAGLQEATSDSWMGSNFFTYLLLRKGADYHKLETKLPSMVEKYMGPQIQKEMGLSLSQFRTKGNELGFGLQPLTSIHLYSDTTSELEPGGNAAYVYIFGGIALFMLLIACINFINLSTAGAAKRAKEVGIRKVAGSGRWQLVQQFMLESFFLVLAAMLLSLVLARLALPVFNQLSGKNLRIEFTSAQVILLSVLTLAVSMIAGTYPAFYLTSFKPISVLKGNVSASGKSFGLRSGLVVFQFFISVSLIIGTIVVWQQMRYLRNAQLGYSKDQLLVLPNSYALGKNERIFRDQLLKDPRVIDAAISSYKPAGPSSNNNALAYPEGRDNQIMKTLEFHIDEHYISTLGMQMVSGRNFSSQFSSDSTGMIINETAARAFGWAPSTAIGKTVVRENSDRGKNVSFHVIGVVRDFNFRSLHESISPLLMTLQPEWGLIIKFRPSDPQGLLSTLKQQWDSYHTDEPFTYNFMDDLYNKMYETEQKTGRIMNIFAVLTALVACLGLFGLVTYTAEQRTKEIGIRKVLGATVTQITGMLSADFLKLVIISCLVAFPLSYWAMQKWLQDFAYRISINWWVFAMAGLLTTGVALFTVSFRAIAAALANPVKSLRNE